MEQSGSVNIQADEDQKIKSQMEKIVPAYDSYMRKVTLGREHILRETTISLAGVKQGDYVLEVGCGTGTLTLAAKRRTGQSGKVYGIDIIPAMIELSQRKAAQAGEEAAFQLGSIDDIPFPADQFDVVLCSFMIFHMSEPVRRKGIAEIYRVLKPQGRLLVLDLALPTHPLPRAIAKMFLGQMLEHDLRELLPLMAAAGFSDVETAPVQLRILGLPILAYMRGCARKS
jgi:ubiquinone/menaquinone biosynthesis C-methylase UbiE